MARLRKDTASQPLRRAKVIKNFTVESTRRRHRSGGRVRSPGGGPGVVNNRQQTTHSSRHVEPVQL